jgi:KaiC/GvpD/RAD55 family RecA-like ATPase
VNARPTWPHESFGWTKRRLERLEELRQWTPEAIARLDLRYDTHQWREGRVIFLVRDASYSVVGATRYQPDPKKLGEGQPKMLADAGTTRELFPPPETIGEEEGDGWLWLVEGEPDCVRAWSLGLAAVGVPGAQNWKEEWAPRFGGRRVAVCFDVDEAGQDSAARAVADLVGCGIDARLVDLTPVADHEGFDLTDFAAKARSAQEREQARRVLVGMAEQAPVANVRPRQGEERRLELRPLASVQPRRVRWLKPGLIALRTLTLVAGVGGLGKSTWCIGVAADVSTGELNEGEPADVVIVSFEDTAEEVLRPRVEAAGGDLGRVHEVVVAGWNGTDPVRLPGDVAELERLVADVQARLVIIDPIVAAIDTALDAHKDQHVRSVLARLDRVARANDCAIAMVGHLNKTPSRDAHIRVANSVAFYNASRSVVLVTPDRDEPERHRLVTQAKANWARLAPVERHVLEEIQLEQLDPRTGEAVVTSRMRYLEDAGDVDRADVLAEPRTRDDGELGRALLFLVDALADGDWHDSAGLKALAGAQGISERTLKRASRELDVEHERRGFPSTTWWRLASQASRAALAPTEAGPTAGEGENPHGSAEPQEALPPVGPVGPAGIEDGPTGAVETDAAEAADKEDV